MMETGNNCAQPRDKLRHNSFHCRVRGASHIRQEIECQDYAGSYHDELLAVASIADGHGSSDCFRSARGAAWAVDSALVCVRQFVASVAAESMLEACRRATVREKLLGQLAKSIISGWNARVEEDYTENPFAEDEMKAVSAKRKAEYRAGKRPELAYGTTLIVVAVTGDYWLGLHIGDGKCVAFSNDGEFSQPIPWDDKCFLNETTSLCDSDAIAEFRYCCGPSDTIPAAIFVASDGIDDCYPVFENEKYLYDFYRAVLLKLVEEGPEEGERQLQASLSAMSQKGSGDDMSVAGLIDLIAVKAILECQEESA